jgi:hypothetical protein
MDRRIVFLHVTLDEARVALDRLPAEEESVKFFRARLSLLEQRLATWGRAWIRPDRRIALLNDAITLLLSIEDVGNKLGVFVDGPPSVDRALARVASQEAARA